MIQIRTVILSDWLAIAELHAKNWQLYYRGSFTDEYLDGPVFEDRRLVWQKRFTEPPTNMKVLVAEQDEILLGFVCYFLEEDVQWGTLVDNLHVSSKAQGQGIGRSLLRKASANIKKETGGDNFYLYVLSSNESAINFYQKLGGKIVEQLSYPNPGGGGRSEVFRIAWSEQAK